MADLLDGVVLARVEQRLGTDGDVGGNPLRGALTGFALDDLGEMLGRKAALTGVEGHLTRLAVMADEQFVEPAEEAADFDEDSVVIEVPEYDTVR